MKRIFLMSCFIIASTLTTSCTADQIATTKDNVAEELKATGGDESGQLPTQKPKK